jgi:sigma-B regulation protein RsbU (phosphoserine phosphatase)
MKFSKMRLWSGISLTTKILIVFLVLSIVSLVIIGSLALNEIQEVGNYALKNNISLGRQAVTDSTNALEDQAEEHLLRLVKDRATISNTLFEKVEAEMNTIARFASTLWSNPPSAGYPGSYSREEKPKDIYAVSVYVLAPNVAVEEVEEELEISSKMDDIFIPVYANDSNLVRVGMGTESGIYRGYPWFSELPPSYDPREREYYQKAAKAGKIGWTELYVDAFRRGLMITCFQPVYTLEGKLVGVVAADVTLKTINEKIINTQVGELGYAFLIDDRGKVVARPGLSAGDKRWDESFKTENLLHSDNRELRKIAEDMIAGNTGIARCTYEGGEKYITYAPITCANWSMGVVMPVEEIIAPALTTESQISSVTKDTWKNIDRRIHGMQNIFIGIFFVVLLVVSSLAFLLSRMLTRPILKVTHAARAMEKGELGEDEITNLSQSKGKNEVASLSRVFASMATQVKNRENRLKKQVEELRIKIDESKKIKEVTKITRSDYFQRLQEDAKKMRKRLKEE